ncbi:restriction endonuclease [Leptolyngbya subtilissima ST-M1]
MGIPTNMPSPSLSFADATIAVLTAEGKPLHYKEITQRALTQGLIQTDGKTPEATLNAILAVDIKQKGQTSRFARVKPGVFGLREWGLTGINGQIGNALESEDDRRVRVPHFPLYSEVRLVLPIWHGRLRSQITGLRSTISSLWGSPQSPVDWTNPDVWIPERLQAQDRELAEAIWRKTNKCVNPRHVYGHWLLACTYSLLTEADDGRMLLTDVGQNFIGYPLGDTVTSIDEQEGVLKILTIAAEKGTGRRGDFVPEWADYLNRYSRFGTDSTIKDTLTRRLQNILDRGLLDKAGTTYSITDEGLSYLGKTGGAEDTGIVGEVQEILELVKRQKAGVRASMQEVLETMDPYAFEHLIKQLLEAMNYQKVMVTSPSNDKGVDVVADIELGITSVREVVQAKRQKTNVQRPVLDALRGSLYRFQAVRGTIITTGDFSKGTVQVAFEPGAPPITLINGEKLIDLLIEYGLGVRNRTIELLELDADAFVQVLNEDAT